MSRMGAMVLDIQERVVQEVQKGFDTRDEMKEVFLEIADELNIPTDWVWEVYLNGDWKY